MKKFYLKVNLCFVLATGCCFGTMFTEHDIEEIKNSYNQGLMFQPSFSRPAPKFIYSINSENEYLAAFAHDGDLVPYKAAQSLGCTGEVSEIREIDTGKSNIIVSKFVYFITNNSVITENIESLLSNMKIKNSLSSNYGTITFKDLLDSHSTINEEVRKLLMPLLDISSVQRFYLFNYLTDQQDLNYTNCLFQIGVNSKIKPVTIDLEKAFKYLPSTGEDMYNFLFKEALDQNITEENLLIIQKNIIENNRLAELILILQESEETIRASYILEERINILFNLYQSAKNNPFSITELFNKGNIKLY